MIFKSERAWMDKNFAEIRKTDPKVTKKEAARMIHAALTEMVSNWSGIRPFDLCDGTQDALNETDRDDDYNPGF